MGNAVVPDRGETPEVTAMNLLDMHTREKVNKIHIAEMHRNARNRHMSGDRKSTGISAIAKGRIRLVLVAVVLILIVGTLLISATISLDFAVFGIML